MLSLHYILRLNKRAWCMTLPFMPSCTRLLFQISWNIWVNRASGRWMKLQRGWFVSCMDWEPEALLKENLKSNWGRAELANEERHEKALNECNSVFDRGIQIAKHGHERFVVDMTELRRKDGEKQAFTSSMSKWPQGKTSIQKGGSAAVRLAELLIFVDGEDVQVQQMRRIKKVELETKEV